MPGQSNDPLAGAAGDARAHGRTLDEPEPVPPALHRAGKLRLGKLLAPTYRRRTITLTAIWFTSLFVDGYLTWLPTMYVSAAGFPLQLARAHRGATPYQDIIVAPGHSPDRQKRSIEALLDRRVDGLILVAPWVEGQWIEDLATRVPIVTVALHGPGVNFDMVVDDEYMGARQMVDHLVALGHRRITHTSMPASGTDRTFVLSHTARKQGYEEAMLRHGLEPDVITTWYSEDGGYRAATQVLARPEPPTAVFAGADIAALGVMRAAEERGLRIPDDLTVTGYDNIFASSINRVSLTTIDQSGHMTGSVSARLMLERLRDRTQPVRYVVAPRLVQRATSAPLPAARTTPTIVGPRDSDGVRQGRAGCR